MHHHLFLVGEEIYSQVSPVLLVVARVVHRELLLGWWVLLFGGNFFKADSHRSQAKLLNVGLVVTLAVLEGVRVRFHTNK